MEVDFLSASGGESRSMAWACGLPLTMPPDWLRQTISIPAITPEEAEQEASMERWGFV